MHNDEKSVFEDNKNLVMPTKICNNISPSVTWTSFGQNQNIRHAWYSTGFAVSNANTFESALVHLMN